MIEHRSEADRMALPGSRVQLFVPCLVDQFVPEIGIAAWVCLDAAGFDVVYPRRQTCCGQVFLNAGRPKRAAGLARRFLRIFDGSEWIVGPSWSCVEMVRSRYGELLDGDDLDEWKSLRHRVFELTEFLTGPAGIRRWPGTFESRVTMHWSCHMPPHDDAWPRLSGLLGSIDGLELSPLVKPECCGFGGVFWSYWRDVSASIGLRRIRALTRDDPGTILTAEPGCLLQLRAAAADSNARVTCLHVAELLAASIVDENR